MPYSAPGSWHKEVLGHGVSITFLAFVLRIVQKVAIIIAHEYLREFKINRVEPLIAGSVSSGYPMKPSQTMTLSCIET